MKKVNFSAQSSKRLGHLKQMLKALAVAAMLTAPGAYAPQALAVDAARDAYGMHNDDRHQYVEVWVRNFGAGGVEVIGHNGKQIDVMAVVVHVTFISDGRVVGNRDYYMQVDPSYGLKGVDKTNRYPDPGFGKVTAIQVTTNKTRAKEPATQPPGRFPTPPPPGAL